MVKERQWQSQFNGVLGLKQGYAITNMPPGCCLDIKNMFLNGLGGKSPRGGYTKLFHTTNGVAGARLTDRIRSLIQYSPFGGTAQQLCFAGTRIFRQNGVTTDVVRSGLTSDVPWDWLQYRDVILGVNGNDTSFDYNGSAFVSISITPPSSQITVTDNGGGSGGLTVGTYEYVYTFYDSTRGRESEPYNSALGVLNAPSVILPDGTRSITLNTFVAPVAGQGVDKYRIYRKRLTETIFTRIKEIAIAAVPYIDNDNTNFNIPLEYDTGQPDHGNTPHPASSLICEQFDRIFMVDPNDPSIAVFSKVGDYWAFPTGNNLFIGRGDGSAIRRLEKHGKSILFHKGNGWYILETDPVGDPTNGVAPGVPRFLSNIGTQDFRTSVSAHNEVVRLTTTGFYRSVPTDFSVTDIREDYIGMDVSQDENQIDWGNSNLASMYNYNAFNRRHVYFVEPISASYFSKCLVYDIQMQQWVYYEIGTDVFCMADYYSNNKKFMMFGDGYGIVNLWDQGSSDGIALDYTLLNGTATSATNTTLTDTTKVDVSSTATGPGSGANTLQDTTQTWRVNQWVNKPVLIVAGAGVGQQNTIASNTVNELTLTLAWGVAVDNTSVYHIGGWIPDQLIGVIVSTWEGTGGGQRRRIIANDSNTITIDAPWTTNPDITTAYSIGVIEKYAEEYWDSSGDPHRWKRMRWVVPYIRQTGDFQVELSFRKDFESGLDRTERLFINLVSSSSLWGFFLWGVGAWGTSTSNLDRARLNGKYHYFSIKYRNRYAGQPFFWDGYGSVFQVLYDRNK